MPAPHNINRTKIMFVAHIKQVGEGCDYTIACGQKLISLKATSMVAAGEEVRGLLASEYSGGDRRLESAVIYEISDTFQVPVEAWYDALREEASQSAAEQQAAARRRQYETLKREFEGK
jgi:hypothetical protein